MGQPVGLVCGIDFEATVDRGPHSTAILERELGTLIICLAPLSHRPPFYTTASEESVRRRLGPHGRIFPTAGSRSKAAQGDRGVQERASMMNDLHLPTDRLVSEADDALA
ncbi:MAG TPA: hypothetical protein VGY55_04005 [Pirellulales bacterium]|nr:hypothetical protein [Pirellulales bacterium]